MFSKSIPKIPVTICFVDSIINIKHVLYTKPEAIEEEKYLTGQYRLGYLHGKGRNFVPLLIPLDCLPAIEMLVEQRTQQGIPTANEFVFASRGKHLHN